MYLGDLTEDMTLDFKFTTRDFDTGAPQTLGGTPALSVYKANGTTQSTAGITLTVDFDSVTGLNHVRIDTSADAFYATGNEYDIVITTGTVDTVSVVGEVVGHFAIENRGVNVQRWADTDVTLGNGAPDVNIASTDDIDLSATQKASVNTEADTALTDYDPPTKAELDTAVADVSVDEIQASALADLFNTDSGTTYGSAVAGSPVKEIADNAGGSSLTVGDIADAVWDEPTSGHTTADTFGEQAKTDIDAILADTNELQSDDIPGTIAALNDLSAAEVNTQVDTALSDIHLDHLLATDYDPASKPGTATALLNELVESDAGVSRFTANALEEGPGGGSAPTAGEVADAVWDEATSGHTTSGTFGEQLKTDVDAVLADTNELQGDWANGGRLDLILDARASQSSVDTVDTVADGIKAVTDNLPDSGALTSIAQASALSTVDGNVDSILADTGTDGVQVADKAGYSLSSSGIDSILDEVVEGSLTHRQILRILLAAMAGKLSGAATTSIAIRDNADSKDRISATVDQDGNRTAVTLDGS